MESRIPCKITSNEDSNLDHLLWDSHVLHSLVYVFSQIPSYANFQNIDPNWKI